MAIALRALHLPAGSEVVLPSICCDAVPIAVEHAELTPVLCDVSPNDYNMDANFVESVLSPRSRVMIAVHLFGYPCPMDALLKLAEEKSLIVVEDAAQAVGGNLGSRKLGSFGELSVVSFGNRKIIDAGGGGAILTSNHSLAREIRTLQRRYQTLDDMTAMASAKVCKLALRLAAAVRDRGIGVPAQLPGYLHLYLRTRFRRMMPEWAEKISRAMGTLTDVVSLRRRNAMIYREIISSPRVSHPKYQHHGWACFRYSVLTKTDLGEWARAELAKRGIWATTLYPSLHRMRWMLASAGPEMAKNAKMMKSKILNLMVAETYPEAEIKRIARTLNDEVMG